MEYGFFMMPYCHGETRLKQHTMVEIDPNTHEEIHAYLLSPNKLPDGVKALLAPSNLAYSMMDNPMHMRDHLTMFAKLIHEHRDRESLTPEILERELNQFDAKLYEGVLKDIDAAELKRCSAISCADETYPDQQDFSRCIKRRFGEVMADERKVSVMDLIYRDAGIRWRMHPICINTKVYAFENTRPHAPGRNKIALYFPGLKEGELKKAFEDTAANATAKAAIEVLLTKIGVTYGYGLHNHHDIRSNDCFVVFHFLKLFIYDDFEQLVASVKSALTKLYGKIFCDSHFRDGCVIDGSCSNLGFSRDDISESQMPNLVSYGDANGKDPVANLLMKASGCSKATIVSFDIKERDAFKTIPHSRRPDSSASASASPARPTQLRYVVIPSTLESFVPPKMLMNGFSLPSVKPLPGTSCMSMEPAVGSPRERRGAVSPISVGNSDDEFGGSLRKKRHKTRKTTIGTRTKPKPKPKNKTKPKTKTKTRKTQKHIQTNIKTQC
jgi:hypothetical protein